MVGFRLKFRGLGCIGFRMRRGRGGGDKIELNAEAVLVLLGASWNC